MITLKWSRVDQLLAGIDKIIADTEKEAQDVSSELAVMLIKDVQSHWSAVSPSSPGNAPAVVTGNLNSSGRVDERAGGGRFASKEKGTLFNVVWNSKSGHDNQERGDYAKVLEYGSPKMKARPFLRPAIERLRPVAISYVKKRLLK